jgi:hypothetical protein
MFRQCGILECSDNVVFWNVPTVWYFVMFRQCGILECSDRVVFCYVPTVWYFGMFRQCGILECSDSVVFWNVPTVWYFGMFRQCGIFIFYFILITIYSIENRPHGWMVASTVVDRGFEPLSGQTKDL